MKNDDQIVKEFLSLAKAMRIEQNITIEQLADMASIHRTTIGLLERFERLPTLQVANQIANALGSSLSEMMFLAESSLKGGVIGTAANIATRKRFLSPRLIRNENALVEVTGLESHVILTALERCYRTIDMIDEQLLSIKSPVLRDLVELANLSSMLGNLLGASIAEASTGLFRRNQPHTFPDLIPQNGDGKGLEIKMALETNRPKGHLPKPGNYITFRYVLGDNMGNFEKGKENRGSTVWIWEVRVGQLTTNDFDLSNTKGDSGKTANIKTEAFKKMSLIFYDSRFLPYSMAKDGTYIGYN